MDHTPDPRAIPGYTDGSRTPLAWRQESVPAVVNSHQLLRGGREVLIRHADQTYRLRHTRNGKLILTK